MAGSKPLQEGIRAVASSRVVGETECRERIAAMG